MEFEEWRDGWIVGIIYNMKCETGPKSGRTTKLDEVVGKIIDLRRFVSRDEDLVIKRFETWRWR